MGHLVTVVVNSYLRPDLVWEALGSVLAQDSVAPFEILLLTAIADLEIPDHLARSAEARGRPIRVILVPRKPIGHALCAAVEDASGRFLAFLDDDDLWECRKLRAVEQALASNPRVAYFHNSQTFVDRTDRPLPAYNLHRLVRHPSARMVEGRSWIVDPADPRSIAGGSPFEPDLNNSSIAIRRSILTDHLDHLRRVRRGEDSFLYYCALLSGQPLYFTSDRLTRYRFHPNTNTVAPSTSESGSDPWSSYAHLADGHLESLGIVRDLLLPSSQVPAGEFVAADIAFWSVLAGVGSGHLDWRKGRQDVQTLLDGSYRRPRLREVIAACSGAAGLMIPSVTRVAFGGWRKVW